MADEVVEYAKNVFTNDGQSDVDGFAKKLAVVAAKVAAAGTITVYYGFHGTGQGELSHLFTPEELKQSLEIAKAFPGAIMVQVGRPDDPKILYSQHDADGQALFTWCDSDTYIKAHKLLPHIVK